MSDINLETSCPWGPDVTHLDVHNMTGKEKMWFAREVNQNGASVSKLAKRFHLKYKQVYMWARRAKNGTILKTKGCPREVLDGTSKAAMERWCLKHKAATASEIRTKLNQEYNQSLRRSPDYVYNSDDSEGEEPAVMSRNTLGRYLAFHRRLCVLNWDNDSEISEDE